MPVRIQRKRTKGWRMPHGAVYVGRPTRWGNPWVVGRWNGAATITREVAMVQYRAWAEWSRRFMAGHPDDPWPALRGRDLACWCPPSAACHADVLLELANR